MNYKLAIWIFSIVTSNRISQIFLFNIAKLSMKIMGIGSGAGVNTSGEESIIKELNKTKHDNDRPIIIIDGGANIGQFANLVARKINTENYFIHSFEPGEKTFKNLKKNLNSNSKSILNNIGIGSKVEEKKLYYDQDSSGLASIFQRDLRQHHIKMDKYEMIKITTIDKYCDELSIHKIDLLKLDLEGFEYEALKGAKKALDEDKVDMICFEFGGTAIDARYYFRDMFYFLKGYGFEIFRITPSGYKFRIDNYSEQLEQFQATNFLARKYK